MHVASGPSRAVAAHIASQYGLQSSWLDLQDSTIQPRQVVNWLKSWHCRRNTTGQRRRSVSSLLHPPPWSTWLLAARWWEMRASSQYFSADSFSQSPSSMGKKRRKMPCEWFSNVSHWAVMSSGKSFFFGTFEWKMSLTILWALELGLASKKSIGCWSWC